MSDLGYGRTVRLHPHRVDHRVGATSVGHVADDISEIVAVPAQIDRVHAAGLGPRDAFRHSVYGDDVIAQVRCDASSHVADRPKSKNRHRATVGNVGVGHGLPRRRQHIG